ncbi:hypothetical protein ACLOJK_004074 [Asimina triloba]
MLALSHVMIVGCGWSLMDRWLSADIWLDRSCGGVVGARGVIVVLLVWAEKNDHDGEALAWMGRSWGCWPDLGG